MAAYKLMGTGQSQPKVVRKTAQ